MNDTLTYIEAYFQNQLSEKEKQEFNERCATDETFASEVAFYVTARQSMKNELLKQKQSTWETATVKTLPVNTPRSIVIKPWLRYAAAACVVLSLSLFFLMDRTDTRTLAEEYIKENYDHLSLKMGTTEDSLELGKKAYNNKDYDKAAALFGTLVKTHPDNAEAKQYAGLVYLVKGNYDKAIQFFDSLAAMKLESNSGKFLKAIALLLRNKNDDKEISKQLLEQVVSENLEGSEEAKKLLKRF